MNKVISSMLITLCAAGAAAQTLTDAAAEASSKAAAPVAYVYVSRPTHLDGFAASSSGKLTAVSGSPFADVSLAHMSVTKKFLFGAGTDNTNLYSYSIGSNGAIKPVSKLDLQSFNGGGCGGFGPTTMDATGTTLYNVVNSECEDETQSFKIESNGELEYLGYADSQLTSDIVSLGGPVVEGANRFAYQVGWGGDEGFDDPYIVSYKRASNGVLYYEDRSSDLPKAEGSDNSYLPYAVASDASDHLAMALGTFNSDQDEVELPYRLASFTVNSSGSLATKSTYENMATVSLKSVRTMSISPNGKYLAAGGSGFQVFHFDGSSPITKLSSALITSATVDQFGWDKSNHLYVLTSSSLHVYTVSSDSVKEASGSPYSIPEASSVIVLSE